MLCVSLGTKSSCRASRERLEAKDEFTVGRPPMAVCLVLQGATIVRSYRHKPTKGLVSVWRNLLWFSLLAVRVALGILPRAENPLHTFSPHFKSSLAS